MFGPVVLGNPSGWEQRQAPRSEGIPPTSRMLHCSGLWKASGSRDSIRTRDSDMALGPSRRQQDPEGEYPGRWGNSSSTRLRGLIRVHLGETSWRLLKMFYRVKLCWSGWEKNQCHLGHCDCVIPLALIGRYLGSHGRCCLSTNPNYAATINIIFDDKRPRI